MVFQNDVDYRMMFLSLNCHSEDAGIRRSFGSTESVLFTVRFSQVRPPTYKFQCTKGHLQHGNSKILAFSRRWLFD